jgi:translocation and assembly module TamA
MVCWLGVGAAVAGVQIEGVDGPVRDNVELYLKLADEPCDAPAWKLERLFAYADAQIQSALEAYGFYHPSITKEWSQTADCWEARFVIAPGDPVRLRKIDVQTVGPGADEQTFVSLQVSSLLQAGQPLKHADYDRYKRRFSDAARRYGYFDARFTTSRIDVYPAELAADVTLSFDTGRRYRFGAITLDQSVIADDLIQRYINFAPGEPFEAVRVTDLYEHLLLTGYFDRIDIRTQPRGAPQFDVPVTISLTAARHRTFTSGIGFGTDTGPKLRAGYVNRRLNRSGHQLEIDTKISEVISEAGVSYRLPLANPRAEWLNIDVGYKYENPDTSRSHLTKVGVKRLKQRGNNWLETEFVELNYEDFRVGEEEGTSFLLVPGISWTQARTSGPPRPQRGHRLNLKFSGTSEWLGSDAQFLQVDFRGKLIRPLWRDARILARVESGYTVKKKFSDLPPSVRYFAGGDFSVRGYQYKTLGPKDDLGEVIGGSHLLTGSLEVDQRVAEKWSVAAFTDAGNAFDDFAEPNLKTSVGVGFRWYSVLGPIRVDLAFPLASDAKDTARLHITLGPDL